MFSDNEEWIARDRELRDLYNKVTQSGEKVNKYISHNEVMHFLFEQNEPEVLTHQYVETPERGLVRNHSKSLNKCLEMLGTMGSSVDKTKSKELRDIISFVENRKPSAGRKTSKIEVGSNRKVRINKNQGYALIPQVAQVFGLEEDADGNYSDHSVVVIYEDENTITIQKRTPLTDPDMLDDM